MSPINKLSKLIENTYLAYLNYNKDVKLFYKVFLRQNFFL